MRIAVVAPACAVPADVPDRVIALAAARFGGGTPEIVFHPQCFLNEGHFAGPDAARLEALVEVANDPSVDAVWFGRGGYGSNRIAAAAVARMGAGTKPFVGYSDMGFLFGTLMKAGIGQIVHGPMPSDIRRDGGEAAIARALDWLVRGDKAACDPATLEAPSVAFNITVLAAMAGTPLMPDLTGKVLMLEEVDEHHYRIDRAFSQIFTSDAVRSIAGVRLGRCAVPDNDRPFGMDEVAICEHWCGVAGVSYLGRADIGHDVDNKVVPFGPCLGTP